MILSSTWPYGLQKEFYIACGLAQQYRFFLNTFCERL